MKVDSDMMFRSNAAQKLVAEHCVNDFSFRGSLTRGAEHSEFST